VPEEVRECEGLPSTKMSGFANPSFSDNLTNQAERQLRKRFLAKFCRPSCGGHDDLTWTIKPAIRQPSQISDFSVRSRLVTGKVGDPLSADVCVSFAVPAEWRSSDRVAPALQAGRSAQN